MASRTFHCFRNSCACIGLTSLFGGLFYTAIYAISLIV